MSALGETACACQFYRCPHAAGQCAAPATTTIRRFLMRPEDICAACAEVSRLEAVADGLRQRAR